MEGSRRRREERLLQARERNCGPAALCACPERKTRPVPGRRQRRHARTELRYTKKDKEGGLYAVDSVCRAQNSYGVW